MELVKAQKEVDLFQTLLANFNSQHLLQLLLREINHNPQHPKLPLPELLKIYHQSLGEKLVPLSIFSHPLAPTAALCKYLRENENLNNKEIGAVLHLQEKSVWATYTRARKQKKAKFVLGGDYYFLPLSVFSDSRLSTLEQIIQHLQSTYHLKNGQIAKLLHKSSNTIAVLAKRGKVKRGLMK